MIPCLLQYTSTSLRVLNWVWFIWTFFAQVTPRNIWATQCRTCNFTSFALHTWEQSFYVEWKIYALNTLKSISIVKNIKVQKVCSKSVINYITSKTF